MDYISPVGKQKFPKWRQAIFICATYTYHVVHKSFGSIHVRLFLSRYDILSRGIVSVHFCGFHFSRPCSVFSLHTNGTLKGSGLSGWLR